MKKLGLFILIFTSVAQAQSTYVTGRTSSGGACTLMADGASGDAKSANACSLTDVSLGYMFNGTSWDRIRGTTTYGLAADITRLPAISITTTFTALAQTLELPVTGQMSVGFSLVPTAFSGDIRAEYQMGDDVWYSANIYQVSSTAGITWTHRGTTLNNPVAAPYVILPMPGATKYRLRVTVYSSGSAAVRMTASFGSPFQYIVTTTGTDTAPGLLQTSFDGAIAINNQTDATKVLVTSASEATLGGTTPAKGSLITGKVTTSAPTYTNSTHNALSLQTDGSLRVAVTAGGGSNASVGTMGSAVPSSGTYVGFKDSGGTNLAPGNLDASGFLKVNVAAGGGSGGTSSTFGAAFPGTGTAIGAKDSAGTNMQPLNLDASGYLKVNVAAGGAGGGNAQLQVYDGSAWQNVRDVAESASVKHVPIKIMDTSANVASVSAGGALKVDNSAVTQPVSAASLPLPTGAAQDSTLTGGTAKAITRGGAKGATSAADVTSTANGADHQGLDVQVQNSALATTQSGTWTVQPGNTANTTPWLVAGNVTPGDAASNPTNTAPFSGFLMGYNGTTWDRVRTANTGRLQVDVVTGGGSNASVGTTGSGVPASATYAGMSVGGTLTGIPGTANGLKVDGSAVTQPVSGTVTANIGTSGSLALDATLTGGSAKTIIRGGTKGATSPADVTSTSSGADHRTLDVSLYDAAGTILGASGSPVWAQGAGTAGSPVGGVMTVQGAASMTAVKTDGSGVTQPVSGTVTANAGTGTMTVGQATGTNLHVVVDSAPTTAVTGTFWQATQPVSISGNQAVNVAQINGVTPLMGNGTTGTGSQRVTIASDQTAFSVNATASQATAANLNATVVGASADNASAASNNVNVLPAVVETSSTMPTRTDGNRAALIVDAKGRLVTRISSTNPWSCTQSGITALTECKALTASTVHYVTHVVLSNGPTAQTLQVVYGTGTNCGTGQTALTSTIYLGVNGGAVIPLDSSPLAPASANAVCCKPSGSSAFSCTLAGYSE
jgi:hypothetical protein